MATRRTYPVRWARRRYGSTYVPPTPWAPTDIAGLKLWLRADGITGLSDGDPVGTWPDESGNGYNLTQAVAANKPLYKTNILNSLPSVRAADTTDYLVNQDAGLTSIVHNVKPWTVFFIWAFTAVPSAERGMWSWTIGDPITDFTDSASHSRYHGTPADHTVRRGVNGVANYAISAHVFDTNPHYSFQDFDGTNPYFREDGVDLITAWTVGGAMDWGTDINAFKILRSVVGGEISPLMDMFELAIYDTKLNSTNIGLLETYTNTKWGL